MALPLLKQIVAFADRIGLRQWLNWHLNRHRRLRLHGISHRVPQIQGVFCSASEPWMLELLRQLLPLAPGRFLDVGANLGQTLIKLKHLEPAREYLGVEPNPVCLHYLDCLIREQNYAATQLVPAGLYEDDRLLNLGFYSDNPADASASLIENFRPQQVLRRRLVPVFRYETIEQAAGSASLGIVKIDVEGAELEVLRGLLVALRRDRPMVLLEVLPAYRAGNRVRLERQQLLAELLKGLDYRLHRVLKDADDDYCGLEAINDFGLHSDLSRCDYLAVPAAMPLMTLVYG